MFWISKSVTDRFTLEPRAAYMTSSCWLVAWDEAKKTYVKTKGSTREYAKWSNSSQAYRELAKRVEKGEL